jgi:hypothetical protein
LLQEDSATVAWSRAKGLAAEGRFAEARSLAEATWRQRAVRQPGQVIGYAEVLVAVGDPDAAAHALVAGFRNSVSRPSSGDEPMLVLDALVHTAGVDVARCLVAELPARLQPTATPARPKACVATLTRFENGTNS